MDLASVTTPSLPALKAYLEGESLLRRGEFRGAIAAYEHALEADSLFALGYFGLFRAATWQYRPNSSLRIEARQCSAPLEDGRRAGYLWSMSLVMSRWRRAAPHCAVPIAAPLLLALAACESATSPRPLSARLTASAVWSGGDAILVSPAFAPPAALPRARIDAETLPVRRVDDSTVAARLPDGDGPRVLTVEAPGFLAFTDTVVLHGFRLAADGPLLTGFLQRLPGGPWVLGAGDPGLVEVDVRTGAVRRQWPDTVHSPDCIWGVGPSVRPGHHVLFGKAVGGGCTHPWVWR
ncbi:MAG: tetratricopeptide repeat protein, partial [Acidimicrobiales bacterium]